MEQLFSVLRAATEAAKIANDQKGRSPFCQIALVTNNDDPLNRRRVKATLQSKGGKTETDWLYRIDPSPYHDPPIPRVGQTVIVFFIDGDPHNGVYLGTVTNQRNVERSLNLPVEDDGRLVEGEQIESIKLNRKATIGQNEDLTIGQSRVTQVGQDDTLTVSGDLTINTDGSITVTGATITVTGSTIDLIGAVSITGSGAINGKDIMVIGGRDNAGHTMVNSGQ